MDIKKCQICSKIFASAGGNICPDCSKKINEMFEKVRDYIYQHKDNDIKEVSKATGVSESWILRFLREGRLILSKESIILRCERCNKPIRTGRYCSECISALDKGLKKGIKSNKNASQSGNRMYIADRFKEN